MIKCDACTSEVEEGDLEIRKPQYGGVPLPFTAKLEIKVLGFPPGNGGFGGITLCTCPSSESHGQTDDPFGILMWRIEGQ